MRAATMRHAQLSTRVHRALGFIAATAVPVCISSPPSVRLTQTQKVSFSRLRGAVDGRHVFISCSSHTNHGGDMPLRDSSAEVLELLRAQSGTSMLLALNGSV